MTPEILPTEDGYFTISKPRPVVIQIQELSALSPGNEEASKVIHGAVEVLEEGKDILERRSTFFQRAASLKRTSSGDGRRPTRPVHQRVRRSSSLGSIEGKTAKVHQQQHCDEPVLRRKPSMRIPIRQDIAIASLEGSEQCDHCMTSLTSSMEADADCVPIFQAAAVSTQQISHQSLLDLQRSSPSVNHHCAGSWGVVLPLTPPDEDMDSFKWELPASMRSTQGIQFRSTAGQEQLGNPSRTQQSANSSSRPSEIRMPERGTMSSDSSGGSTWIGRACDHLVSALGDSSSQSQIQMVVQALPSPGKVVGAKTVFEKVVEVAQNQYKDVVPYITITHAVSQVISMDEVPASPPATPNTVHSSDDYFQDQTIFTHAAVVPAYHAKSQQSSSIHARATNIIAAPMSIQLTTLERYLPPPTAQEYVDFFSISRRSYLVDRLLELSAADGGLLLIYPTKTGARTFANNYLAPVIEPFLRQFVLLNNLHTEIAVTLGRMGAAESMQELAEMQRNIQKICDDLGSLAPSRGLSTRYHIVHAETAEVVLDRQQWIDWFLEQEQPRIRQNLVDYHKAGGRMPSRAGQLETTPGMLAREVNEGIRHSRQEAGDAGIEVGVFVIRRTTL